MACDVDPAYAERDRLIAASGKLGDEIQRLQVRRQQLVELAVDARRSPKVMHRLLDEVDAYQGRIDALQRTYRLLRRRIERSFKFAYRYKRRSLTKPHATAPRRAEGRSAPRAREARGRRRTRAPTRDGVSRSEPDDPHDLNALPGARVASSRMVAHVDRRLAAARTW